jgi:hypothetical protein
MPPRAPNDVEERHVHQCAVQAHAVDCSVSFPLSSRSPPSLLASAVLWPPTDGTIRHCRAYTCLSINKAEWLPIARKQAMKTTGKIEKVSCFVGVSVSCHWPEGAVCGSSLLVLLRLCLAALRLIGVATHSQQGTLRSAIFLLSVTWTLITVIAVEEAQHGSYEMVATIAGSQTLIMVVILVSSAFDSFPRYLIRSSVAQWSKPAVIERMVRLHSVPV